MKRKYGFGLRYVASFATDQLGFLRTLADRGDIVPFEMFGKPFFAIHHPEDVETLLVKHARVMGRDDYIDILQRTLGLGLLTSDGDLWKRQRKLMSQAFVPKRIHGYGAAMVRVHEPAKIREYLKVTDAIRAGLGWVG